MSPDSYPEYMAVFVSVIIVLTCYSIYRIFLTDYITKKFRFTTGNTYQVLFHRLSGVLLFGLIPLLSIFLSGDEYSEFGLKLPGVSTLLWTLLLALIILPVNFFIARSSQNLSMYPQIRKEVWSIQLLFISAISWCAYLVAYEFMLRGFLFSTTLPVMGLWPSILLNTVIYSLIHMHKGMREMVASVPMGIALCYLTYLTGNIWTSVFTHIIMALTNEWFSIYLHPSMVVRRIKK